MNPERLTLSETTGHVLSARKWSETHVSGGGGGGSGFHAQGYGHSHTSPVRISSSTTTKDQIFLGLPNGRECALNLSGFDDLACREGHQITALMAQTPRDVKKESGWWIAIHNHATDQTSWNKSRMKALAKPPLAVGGLVFVALWIVAIAWSVAPGIFFGWIPAAIVTYGINELWSAQRTERLRELSGRLLAQTREGLREAGAA